MINSFDMRHPNFSGPDTIFEIGRIGSICNGSHG